jgi:hypothetical protein
LRGGKAHRGGRGVCKRCYNRYAYLVRKGAATWEQLERAGLVLLRRQPFKLPDLRRAPWAPRKQP